MNTYLLGLLGKWISILFISVTGLLHSSDQYANTKIEVNNLNPLKNSTAEVQIIKYKTTKTYNDNVQSGIVTTKKEGQNGFAYIDNETKETKVIEPPTNKVVEVGTKEKDQYVGKLTGYGADCAGCSGTVSCKTKTGSTWNLVTDGKVYNDSEYGNVRILAAALNKFPCGTIIEVVTKNLGTFNAIVLDTGGSMRSAWKNGKVHMDLAFVSENESGLYLATGSNIQFNIKRWGW